jgi:hypothetical protein
MKGLVQVAIDLEQDFSLQELESNIKDLSEIYEANKLDAERNAELRKSLTILQRLRSRIYMVITKAKEGSIENENGLKVGQLLEFLKGCDPDAVIEYTHLQMADYAKAQKISKRGDTVVIEDICRSY